MATPVVVDDGSTSMAQEMLQNTVPIEIVKRPLKRNHPKAIEVAENFKSQSTEWVEPLEKSHVNSSNGGWLTRDQLGKELNFEVELQNASIYDPTKIRLVMEVKLQLKTGSGNAWEDYARKHTSSQFLNLAVKSGDNSVLVDPANSNADVADGGYCGRFSSPLPIIQSTTMKMNSVDRLNNPLPTDAFKNWFRKTMLTTDHEKRVLGLEYENDYYDEDVVRGGTFLTDPSRDCMGFYLCRAELDANGGALHKSTKNVRKMEADLLATGGVKYLELPIPNSFFEIDDNRPGWQTWKLTCSLSPDSLLVVGRESAKSGKGAALDGTKIRIMYNIKKTYLRIQWHEPLDKMVMAKFTKDDETLVTAEKTQLLVSESFPKTVTQSEGLVLRHFSNPFDGSFPVKGHVFFIPQKDLEGEGYFDRDAFSIKPWNVTHVAIKHGGQPIFAEKNEIPWRPYDRASDGSMTLYSERNRMFWKMALDANKPAGQGERENRGSGHRDRLQMGLWVGYYDISAENAGMNGFTKKENAKLEVIVKTDNQSNSSADQPPSDLVGVIAYFEPEHIKCINATANRWLGEDTFPQALITQSYTQSHFGGDPAKY